jgi:hypothetical protein
MREGEKNLLLEEESAQKDIHITRFWSDLFVSEFVYDK